MVADCNLDHWFEATGARADWLGFETDAPVDDLMIKTSEGGVIAIQAKTTVSLSPRPDSRFAEVIDQFVRHWLVCRDGNGNYLWDRPLNPGIDHLVLAVGPRAPNTVCHNFPDALQAYISKSTPRMGKGQSRDFECFEACARSAWQKHASQEPFPEEQLLQELARLITVARFDPKGTGRATAASLMSEQIQDPYDANAAASALERICGEEMSRRGGFDAKDLRRKLAPTVRLLAPPDYRRDVARLKERSKQVTEKLKRHEVIETEAGSPVHIERECQAAVNAAAQNGSFLAVGEPGTGKSGVLNALARSLMQDGKDVLALAVDDFSDTDLGGLSKELGIQHELLDVLEAWDDGQGPAWLIIDALDATRGGGGEAAFRALIDRTLNRNGRWLVVASIRSFDLRMGRKFRDLFEGPPPDAEFIDPTLENVRHLKVPSWSEQEFMRLQEQMPSLKNALQQAPHRLRELATVPFNTRLICELIAESHEAPGADLNAVGSQVALMRLHWDHRIGLHNYPAEACLREIVHLMVKGRTLQASRQEAIREHPETVQDLVRCGALIESPDERWFQFRHHLLFDYAASRVYLHPEDLIKGDPPFPSDQALGLVLAPAFSFVLQELWESEAGHERFWQSARRILSDVRWDPVIRAAAARRAIEWPVSPADIECLFDGMTEDTTTFETTVQRIIGALGSYLEEERDFEVDPWVYLANIMSRHVSSFAHLLNTLIHLIIKRVKNSRQCSDLGEASRILMEHELALDESLSMTRAIELVAQTFATDQDASRALLSRLFENERLSRFGGGEIYNLIQRIDDVAGIDPSFVAEIYRQTYAQEIREDRPTPLSFSQILPLTSSIGQDLRRAQWLLGEFFPDFLQQYPEEAMTALVDAIESRNAQLYKQYPSLDGMGNEEFTVDGKPVRLLEDHSHIWARDPDDHRNEGVLQLISAFRKGLRDASVQEARCIVSQTAQQGFSAVIWSRLFLAVAKRGDAIADLVWPYASHEKFLVSHDTRKDAIDAVVSGLKCRSETERSNFEHAAMHFDFSAFSGPSEERSEFLSRLFAAIGADDLKNQVARDWFRNLPEDKKLQNKRLFSIETRWEAPPRPIGGIDPNKPENAAIIKKIEAAKAVLGIEQNHGDVGRDQTFLEAIEMLESIKDTANANLPARPELDGLIAEGDALIAGGCAKTAEKGLVPEHEGPDLDDRFIALIEHAARSPSPPVDANTEAEFEASAHWSSPAARVSAAEAALDILFRHPRFFHRLLPIIRDLAADRHPAVRLQAGQRLAHLWDIDRDEFWRLTQNRLQTESNPSVLEPSVPTLIDRVVHAEPEKTEALVLSLLARFEDTGDRGKGIRWHVASGLAILWLRHERADARDALHGWMKDPTGNTHELLSVISILHGGLVWGLEGDEPSPPMIRVRSQRLLNDIVDAATGMLEVARRLANPGERQADAVRQCESILDAACGQFQRAIQTDQYGQAGDAPLSASGIQILLKETAGLLMKISQHASARTVFHLLEMAERFIPASPKQAFGIVASALTKGDSRPSLRFEALVEESFVQLVGIFLADHKAIFNNDARRAADLMLCLGIFAEAGWPKAQRLLYQLPELLR